MKGRLLLVLLLTGILICFHALRRANEPTGRAEKDLPLRVLHPRLETYFVHQRESNASYCTRSDTLLVGLLCEAAIDGSLPALEAAKAMVEQDLKSPQRRIQVLLLVTPLSSRNPQTLADHARRMLKSFIEGGYVHVILTPSEFYKQAPRDNSFSEMSMGNNRRMRERHRLINLSVAFMMKYAASLGCNFLFYDDSLRPRNSTIDEILRITRNSPDHVLSIDFGVGFYGRWFSVQHLGGIAWYLYNLPYFTVLNDALYIYKSYSLRTTAQQESSQFSIKSRGKATNFRAMVKTDIELQSPVLSPKHVYYADPFWLRLPKANSTLDFHLSEPRPIHRINVITGKDKFLRDALTDALLEASYSPGCTSYTLLEDFESGEVHYRTENGKTVHCLRVLITADQMQWNYIRYIEIL